jgi:hypothetical protein
MAARKHRAMAHKPKIHKGADVFAGSKGGNRRSKERRAKGGSLGKTQPGEGLAQFSFGKQNARRRPKAPEPDTVGRLVRPAAHNKRQSGVAARAKKTVKRLSDQMI